MGKRSKNRRKRARAAKQQARTAKPKLIPITSSPPPMPQTSVSMPTMRGTPRAYRHLPAPPSMVLGPPPSMALGQSAKMASKDVLRAARARPGRAALIGAGAIAAGSIIRNTGRAVDPGIRGARQTGIFRH